MRLACRILHVELDGALGGQGTPADVLAKLNRAVVGTFAEPSVRLRLAGLGLDLPPREQQTSEALRIHHKAEIEKWWPIIWAANIKPE